MYLKEVILEINNMYYSMNDVFYTRNIKLSFEIELLIEKLSIIETLNINILHEIHLIYTIDDFIKMEDISKINYLLSLLNQIEKYLLQEVNEFVMNNTEFPIHLINDSEIILFINNIQEFRKNNVSENFYNTIKNIFHKIFLILDKKQKNIDKKFVEFKELKKVLSKLPNFPNNDYKRINNEINILTKKLKELENLEEKEKDYESERLEKDKLIKELEFKNKQLQEQLEKENELEKINRAIDKLQVPCDELQKSQDKFRENRDNYDKYAMDMFKVATIIFVFMTFYLSFFTEINDVSKSVSIGYYLTHSFPILFPTIIGFLFIRQSNVNSKELDKINRRFILIHEVGQSLRALNEINDEKQMNEKTQKIIDKLIENILNYASENNSVMKNEESSILELNEHIDKLIDTIDKKLTVIGKPE